MVLAVYTVRCDVCPNAKLEVTVAGRNSTRNTARAEAVKQGWQRFGGRDVCPDCWKSMLSHADRARNEGR